MCASGDISGSSPLPFRSLFGAAGAPRALRLRLLRLVGFFRLLGLLGFLGLLRLVATAFAGAVLTFRFRLRRLRAAALLAGVVGDVPAGPLELEGRRGDELLHLAAAARAGGERGIIEALEDLGPLPAIQALVLVKRHSSPLLQALNLSPCVLKRILIALVPVASSRRGSGPGL